MTSIMHKEAASAAAIVAKQFIENQSAIQKLVVHLKKFPPTFAFTIARGSSDHAAFFGQYLLAMQSGLVTASLPPSITSIYHRPLSVKGALAIAISQSGASPDICAGLQAAKDGGAITVAFVNTVDSTLANIADFIIPLHAGKEHAVAATKTYIASISALIQLVACLSDDKTLLRCLPQLPDALEAAADCNWQTAVDELKEAVNLITISRGLGFPIAQEAALKFKETANIHAEAFSGAEFQHGPMALARQHFPLLFLAQQDAAFPSLLALSERMTTLGANTFFAVNPDHKLTAKEAKHALALPPSLHPVCDPLVMIQTFYPMVASLALARGYNPDVPHNLRKITETH